ncbi:FecR family protein [Arachidicoccus sp.]|uniref:FecR family protein n=1 Tax=Arachidicoccus sp. TaxID=1872624 RepID=UPI003D1A8593
MLSEDLKELIGKYLDGTATEEERSAVLQWYRSTDLSEVSIDVSSNMEASEIKNRISLKLQQHIKKQLQPNAGSWLRRMSAAALVLLLLGMGGYFFLYRFSKSTKVRSIAIHQDLLPGHSGAILHLSDGKTIVLDSIQNGLVLQRGNLKIIKENGSLSYIGKCKEPLYNTITTNRGRQWQLTLPDGSKAWLNAASSIKYPLTFDDKNRIVEITGEVYFEVIHNPRQPFIVKAGDKTIQDIGTAFNINDYKDEPVSKTTVIQGSVRISKAGQSAILRKGQQASIAQDIRVSEAVNLEEVLAWKNGNFLFQDATLQEVMRTIGRWYNVSVQYEAHLPHELFNGKIPRALPASKVLDILKQSGIHFTIESVPSQEKPGKIIVTP